VLVREPLGGEPRDCLRDGVADRAMVTEGTVDPTANERAASSPVAPRMPTTQSTTLRSASATASLKQALSSTMRADGAALLIIWFRARAVTCCSWRCSSWR